MPSLPLISVASSAWTTLDLGSGTREYSPSSVLGTLASCLLPRALASQICPLTPTLTSGLHEGIEELQVGDTPSAGSWWFSGHFMGWSWGARLRKKKTEIGASDRERDGRDPGACYQRPTFRVTQGQQNLRGMAILLLPWWAM